jgi:hypothetical protein
VRALIVDEMNEQADQISCAILEKKIALNENVRHYDAHVKGLRNHEHEFLYD